MIVKLYHMILSFFRNLAILILLNLKKKLEINPSSDNIFDIKIENYKNQAKIILSKDSLSNHHA